MYTRNKIMLDGGNTGYGLYAFEISVNVNTGSAGIGLTVCQNEDSGEEVDWVIELISLEYTAEKVDDEESEDDDSDE